MTARDPIAANERRLLTFGAALMVGFGTGLAASPASAARPIYPYCYIDYDGLRSCSFRTLQECYQIRVGTGMCVVNPYFGSKAR